MIVLLKESRWISQATETASVKGANSIAIAKLLYAREIIEFVPHALIAIPTGRK